MTVSEKVAYLKGLMEGMELKDDSKETKILRYISEILEDMAAETEEMQGDIADINDYMEAMDEDLTTVEEELFDIDDEDEDEEEEMDGYELTCPHCDNVIVFEEEPEGDTVTCPSCGEEISLNAEE